MRYSPNWHEHAWYRVVSLEQHASRGIPRFLSPGCRCMYMCTYMYMHIHCIPYMYMYVYTVQCIHVLHIVTCMYVCAAQYNKNKREKTTEVSVPLCVASTCSCTLCMFIVHVYICTMYTRYCAHAVNGCLVQTGAAC